MNVLGVTEPVKATTSTEVQLRSTLGLRNSLNLIRYNMCDTCRVFYAPFIARGALFMHGRIVVLCHPIPGVCVTSLTPFWMILTKVFLCLQFKCHPTWRETLCPVTLWRLIAHHLLSEMNLFSYAYIHI